jgi:putative SOS response-associated peptidase YedK
MCGRFALFAAGEELVERFQLAEFPHLEPRYNIAPMQNIAVVRLSAAGRRIASLRWGLIPSWAADPAIGNKLLNARSETVTLKPSFRAAFKQRRCLIPASGFYEWVKVSGSRKQPYFIRPREGGLFALAGLWEQWRQPQGEAIETFTILTTEANEIMRPLHDRMPVILGREAEDVWLNSHAAADALRSLFAPYFSDRMETRPVCSWVSNPKNEGPRCLEPTSE